MNMKQCTKCGESKTTDEFIKPNQSKDGLAVICKKCKSEYDRSRRANKKQCSKCGRKRPITEFHKNPSTKDGLQCACKRCLNERSRETYLARKNASNTQPIKKPEPGGKIKTTEYAPFYLVEAKQKPQNLKIHAAYLTVIACLVICSLILL